MNRSGCSRLGRCAESGQSVRCAWRIRATEAFGGVLGCLEVVPAELVTLAAAALNVFLLGAQRASSAAGLGGWSSFLLLFLLWLLIPGAAGTWEEPGFRGYALPRLQFRYSALLASLILGALWAFWHLPFVVTGEDIWIDALLFTIEWSITYTWLFNNAKGSVLIVMLFHAMNNTFSSGFVGQMFSGPDSVNQAWLRLTLCPGRCVRVPKLVAQASKAGGTSAGDICGIPSCNLNELPRTLDGPIPEQAADQGLGVPSRSEKRRSSSGFAASAYRGTYALKRWYQQRAMERSFSVRVSAYVRHIPPC